MNTTDHFNFFVAQITLPTFFQRNFWNNLNLSQLCLGFLKLYLEHRNIRSQFFQVTLSLCLEYVNIHSQILQVTLSLCLEYVNIHSHFHWHTCMVHIYLSFEPPLDPRSSEDAIQLQVLDSRTHSTSIQLIYRTGQEGENECSRS